MSGGEPGKPDGQATPGGGTEHLLARGLAAAGGGPGSGAAPGGWEAPLAEVLAEAFPGLRVMELAGRGGMGAVYRAEQTRLGRTVAVKILPPAATPDPLARERFEREARVLSGINHPNVLQIYDFGALPDGMLYLVTEWADAGDLARLLGGKPQPLAEVCGWVAQIASALDAAHARGVVHRDLKPANVLVRADGRLALADFGLAHARGAGFTTTLTLSGMVFGTFDYMAPEQMGVGGAVTPATDVYALGVMTYQMLTGRVPKGAYARPSRLTGAPVAVDELIDAAMANEPQARPGGAGEFARRLAEAARGGRAGAGGAAWTGGRRSRLPVIVGLGAAAIAGALWVTSRPRGGAVVGEPAPTPVVVAPPATFSAESAPLPVAFPVTARQEPAKPPAPVVSDASIREPEAAAPGKKTPEKEAPWTWVLPEVRVPRDVANGAWMRTASELVAGDDVCALRLPVRVAADFSYDVAVEFTRKAGKNSVGVFLPTSAGTGVFELDAWDQGLGGIQMIDGQDMRAHGQHFPAPLKNGVKQRLILQVRGARISVVWNGEPRMTWNLAGRRFDNNWMWDAGADMGLGLCTWKSPTVFHRVAYRAVATE